MNTIRAFHILPTRYALEDLEQRRLKIARLDELNDPFELWAVGQPDKVLRHAIRMTKDQMAQQFGLLCFCLSWHNPLVWSHYGDKHHGVALGFDIDKEIVKPVDYVENRPTITKIDIEIAQFLLYTKYKDWQYEQEVRIFTTLEEKDESTGLYYAAFGEQLRLREVIVGPLSAVTKRDLEQTLGVTADVSFTKGRLAFNSFQVVPDLRGLGES